MTRNNTLNQLIGGFKIFYEQEKILVLNIRMPWVLYSRVGAYLSKSLNVVKRPVWELLSTVNDFNSFLFAKKHNLRQFETRKCQKRSLRRPQRKSLSQSLVTTTYIIYYAKEIMLKKENKYVVNF